MKFFLAILLLVTFLFAQEAICVIEEYHNQWGGRVYYFDGASDWQRTEVNISAAYCSFDDNNNLWLISLEGNLYSTDGSSVMIWGTTPTNEANDISVHHGRILIAVDNGVVEFDPTNGVYGVFTQVIYCSSIASVEHVIDEDDEMYCIMGESGGGDYVVSYNFDYPESGLYFYPVLPFIGYDVSFDYSHCSPTVICDNTPNRTRRRFNCDYWEIVGSTLSYNRIDVSISGDVVISANPSESDTYFTLNGEVIYIGDTPTADIAVSGWSL